MSTLALRLSRPPAEVGPPESLAPIFPPGTSPDLAAWLTLRGPLRDRWVGILGHPSFEDFDRSAEVVDTFDAPGFRGTVYKQPTGPDSRQTVLLMEPATPPVHPRPCAVVPFYDPDRMAGLTLSTREPIADTPLTQFGRHLVRQGYVVACSEAFPYNTIPAPADNSGLKWWQAAAAKLLSDNPGWTGIGKLAWDASRALDLLLEWPAIDAGRTLVMGHSLGGKIAFYAAALDERFTAVIGSDFGLGFAFTNWDAPWYLGPQIHDPGFPVAHHHLLSLIAPRPFLLLGGQADRPASWQYITEAQKVYALYGKPHAAGFFHHGAGHRPTDESLHVAYRWLAEQFALTAPSLQL